MMSMISLLKPLTDIPSREAWNECQPLFPLHPRMNPKMVNSAETSGSLWSCRISPIGRWQPAVSSWLRKHMKAEINPGLFRKRYLSAEQRKQRHPSSRRKKAESSMQALGQNKQEIKRVCSSCQTEIYSNACFKSSQLHHKGGDLADL